MGFQTTGFIFETLSFKKFKKIVKVPCVAGLRTKYSSHVVVYHPLKGFLDPEMPFNIKTFKSRIYARAYVYK